MSFSEIMHPYMYIYHAVKQLFVCACGAVRAGSYVCLTILIKKVNVR